MPPSRFSLCHRQALATLLLASALVMAGCSRDQDGAAQGGADDIASLPGPESGGGSVTGMPDQPGPGPVGPPSTGETTLPPDTAIADDGSLVFPATGDTPAGEVTATPPMPATEPTADDAIAVVRGYYAAIDARQYAHAYALWSGGGSASGQSPEQFAAGFADTTDVVVEPGAPGRLDAAAGSRFIEVPVSVRATREDGSVHRYAGSYTLRRAVVDGATAEQRAWRIASADIREVR
jgi:hypothetical protein